MRNFNLKEAGENNIFYFESLNDKKTREADLAIFNAVYFSVPQEPNFFLLPLVSLGRNLTG